MVQFIRMKSIKWLLKREVRPRIISQNFILTLIIYAWLITTLKAASQNSPNSPLRVVVTNNQDGEIQPDNALTLREAISIVNGELPLERLSETERNNVSSATGNRSQIEFNLPPGNTTIELKSPLPALAVPVVIDGTTQPGYAEETRRNISQNRDFSPPLSAPIPSLTFAKQRETNFCTSFLQTTPNQPLPIPTSEPPVRGLGLLKQTIANFPIPQPIIVIKPAAGMEVFRGFTVVSDNVRIRGLSIYGFSSRRFGVTANIPPADIFIAKANDAATFGNQKTPIVYNKNAPKDVVIDCNWLGVDRLGNSVSSNQIEKQLLKEPIKTALEIYRTDDRLPTRSAFGVYVFNSLGTTITNNVIADHDGSGIVTSKKAINMLIAENILFANGFGGMPDAIRLEGNVAKTRVISNLIRDNAGSAIYMFKPEGSVEIKDNKIINNGRQFEQAAIYLMGNDHQIINNQISEQPGPGVVVAAFPNSDRNVILGNSFANIKGLSIDLVTQMNTGFHAYLTGDGANPKMQSFQRRRQTANFGIDAPSFVSKEFFLDPQNNSVTLQGTAKPGATVEIYRVNEDSNRRGPLSEAIADTVTDKDGKFSIIITNLKAEERVSAIANDSESGTSEPAVNAIIKQLP